MDLYQQYIHKSRYARYLPELKRREHWDETVERFVSFVASKISNNALTTEVRNNIKNAINYYNSILNEIYLKIQMRISKKRHL